MVVTKWGLQRSRYRQIIGGSDDDVGGSGGCALVVVMMIVLPECSWSVKVQGHTTGNDLGTRLLRRRRQSDNEQAVG